MTRRRSRYLRHRFPPEIISHAVWFYYRYGLSFRDVDDLLAERGVIVSFETVRQWFRKFGPDYARRLKRRPKIESRRLALTAIFEESPQVSAVLHAGAVQGRG